MFLFKEKHFSDFKAAAKRIPNFPIAVDVKIMWAWYFLPYNFFRDGS